jgi:hypothetical protein
MDNNAVNTAGGDPEINTTGADPEIVRRPAIDRTHRPLDAERATGRTASRVYPLVALITILAATVLIAFLAGPAALAALPTAVLALAKLWKALTSEQ